MNCRELNVELGAYLDGDLSAALRRELEIHLRHCHPCWVLVDTCRCTISIFRQYPAPVVPALLHQRVVLSIQALAPTQTDSGLP